MNKALIIPCYLENEALPILLYEINLVCDAEMLIIVADDSPEEIQHKLFLICQEIIKKGPHKIEFSIGQQKSGRGNAVRRSIAYILQNHPGIEFVVEADADGSHSANDIHAIMSQENFDIVIGSRYLKGSLIIGWPKSRKIFSFLLNLIIPRLFSLNVSDVTNGLRMYTKEMAKELTLSTPKTTGFIYLTEQLLTLRHLNPKVGEFPITFVNRTIGKSTVTYKEIIGSIKGLYLLLSMRKK